MDESHLISLVHHHNLLLYRLPLLVFIYLIYGLRVIEDLEFIIWLELIRTENVHCGPS